MPSAIEECGSHLGAVEIVHRPETYPYQVVAIGILTQGNRESGALYLQRHVDESLGVALDIIESLEVGSCEREEGCMTCGILLQLLIQYISPKSDFALARHIIYIAINLVLVNTFCEQLTNDKEYLGASGVERESPCVGHHSAIARHCKMMSKPLESSQLPYDAEDEFAC